MSQRPINLGENAELRKTIRAIGLVLLSVLSVTIILYLRSSLPVPRSVENTQDDGFTDWQHYHSYSETVSVLLSINLTYPNIVDLFPIGKSLEDRTIYCVRLTDESNEDHKPEVLFVGCHHANEQIASELPLYFIVHTAKGFDSTKSISNILSRTQIYVIVALNVDGSDQLNERPRYNARGVDLNRNYGYAWNGGGSQPFSEPETQAMRDLVLNHNFTYALSFHSGTELILYPWACTKTPPTDEAKFTEIVKDISKATWGTPYEQSSDLYIAYGTWGDWAYGVKGVMALTCEIYGEQGDPETSWRGNPYVYNPIPANIKRVILRWLPALFYIANRTTS